MSDRPQLDDLALWNRACAGDPDAKHQLAETAVRIARAQAARFRLSVDEAEEVASRLVQTVFDTLESGRTAPHTSLTAWLRVWYWSVRKDYLRDRRKHQRSEPLAEDTGATLHAPAIDAAELQELRLAIQHCLGQLPEVQRAAILLRYGHGLSVPQSRSALPSQNPNTIRIWIFRGMTALRNCLTRRGIVL